MIGSAQAIISNMLPAAMWLKNRMAEINCDFATRSFFMAAGRDLEQVVADHCVRVSLPLSWEAAGRDLGLDVSMGCVRRIPTRAVRWRGARDRLDRTSVAAKAVGAQAAAKLSIAGAIPQLMWGRVGQGTGLAEVHRIRGRVCKALGLWKSGGCTTTSFALGGFARVDPWFKIPLDCVTGVLVMVMQASAADRRLIQ